MKKILLLTIAVLVAAGCTSIKRLDSGEYRVIEVPQGLRDAGQLAQVAQDLTNGIPVIFKMVGGEQMPLKLAVDLPMGTVEEGDCIFSFKQDTYLFLSPKDCLISPDGQRWAGIQSPRSVAKVFGSKHGEFRFGFSSSTNEEPVMNIDIKAE